MKKIWSITKVELAQLFYSPIAWIIIVIFGFQVFQTFSAAFMELAEGMDMYGSLKHVTYELFAGRRGLFPAICSSLYLYIPLLTMGMMSRDMSNGSIKLLYSSPVTASHIISGKFLSMIIFSMIMISLVIPTIVFAYAKVPDIDVGLILSGLLGVMLLFWAYISIGLFMSCLTSYQMVAALLTFGAFTLMNQLGTMGQKVNFLRDITYWASISGRTEQFISGLISTEDLAYFLAIIASFVCFSIFLLQYKKNNKRGVMIIKYVSTLLLLFSIGYLTSRPVAVFYHDATATKVNTITPNSKTVLDSLEGPLKVTTYVNLSDFNCWMASPVYINNDIKSFKSYIRFKPDIDMKYVYYYDEPYCNRNYGMPDARPAKEIAMKYAKSYGIPFRKVLTPKEIHEIIDLKPERNSIVKVLETQDGKKAVLRTFEDMIKFPQEEEIATAMKRLSVPAKNVGFLEGHGERNIHKKADEDYYNYTTSIKERDALINKGFDAVSINLSAGDSLKGIDILVIADLRSPLTSNEERQIMEYLDNGGNLLLAVEPAWVENSRSLLDYLGVFTFSGTLVSVNEDKSPTLIPTQVTPASTELSKSFVTMSTVTMQEAMSIEYKMASEWEAWPLLYTDKNCWNETDIKDFHRMKEGEVLKADITHKEFKKRHVTALGLSRDVINRNQRVIVLGDADCISNLEMTIKRKGMMGHNKYFFKGMFNWLSDNVMPVNVKREQPKDNIIELTPDAANTWSLLFKWLISTLLTIIGSVVVIRRSGR